MRLRWVYLIVIIVLLECLAEASGIVNAPRKRTRQSRKGAAKRVASGKTNKNKVKSGAIQPKIVGGVSQSITTMKYMVQIHHGTSVCGGCLVGTQWVMTAAHCVYGITTSNIYAMSNSAVLNDSTAVNRTVSDVFIPTGYSRASLNADIALLKLNDTMSGDNVAVIPVSSTPPRAGSFLRVGGWGSRTQGGSTVTNLRSVRLRVLRHQSCVNNYRGRSRITRKMFCARTRGRDTCFGDSGGAMVQNGEVYGIVSFGYGCNKSYPGVYTLVSAFYNWITNTIANN